jgi:hypothetical protein
MWSSENERLGFKQCSPIGYLLTKIAFVSFISSAILFFIMVFLILERIFSAEFSVRLFLILLIPLFFLLVGLSFNATANILMKRKRFKYDYESDKCTWDKN